MRRKRSSKSETKKIIDKDYGHRLMVKYGDENV